MLKPGVGETLEVQDAESGDWSTWELREDFVGSTEFDRHFVLDQVSGEIEFGPAIRETDGGWTQYGAIPPKGAVLRFARYRHGGGRRGNITAGRAGRCCAARSRASTRSRTREPAIGGVDAEALEHARQRASMEIRTRYRAVTAEDFEFLAGEASPRVARAVCIPPAEGGAVPLHIVPHVYPADRQLPYSELVPDAELMAEVAAYLDERRLIGTTVQLEPCKFRGLSVVVNLQASPLADTARVEEDVAHALYTYLNPLVGGSAVGPGTGLGVRARAQPGRALRRRARGRRRRVREDPAHLRDEPGDRRAVAQAGRHPHRARARRADRLRRAHRQGEPPGGLRVAEDGTQNGGDEYRTFAGAGFGTLMVRLASGPKETPPVASSRAYLRDALPAVYQEGDFGMRFIGALETLLDPIVAVLDALPAHFSADHAPRDVLDLLSAWLGVDLDESQTPAQRRAMVRQAAELGRRRGTRAGLELALSLAFPKLPLRVEDLRRGEDGSTRGGNRGAARDVHRVLRQADRGRRSRRPSRVASSSTSRYTRPTDCA